MPWTDALASLDLGDIPTWVGSVATGGSAVVAATTYTRSQRRQYAQAVAVTATLTEEHQSETEIGFAVDATVHNAGSLPIYEASLNLSHPALPDVETQASVGILEPGQAFTAPLRVVFAPQYVDTKDWEVALRFRDSAGRYWQRTPALGPDPSWSAGMFGSRAGPYMGTRNRWHDRLRRWLGLKRH